MPMQCHIDSLRAAAVAVAASCPGGGAECWPWRIFRCLPRCQNLCMFRARFAALRHRLAVVAASSNIGHAAGTTQQRLTPLPLTIGFGVPETAKTRADCGRSAQGKHCPAPATRGSMARGAIREGTPRVGGRQIGCRDSRREAKARSLLERRAASSLLRGCVG